MAEQIYTDMNGMRYVANVVAKTTPEYERGVVDGMRTQLRANKRPWVDLTDEDFQPEVQKAMVYYGYKPEHLTLTSGAGFYVLTREIEAKLKEKNA